MRRSTAFEYPFASARFGDAATPAEDGTERAPFGQPLITMDALTVHDDELDEFVVAFGVGYGVFVLR